MNPETKELLDALKDALFFTSDSTLRYGKFKQLIAKIEKKYKTYDFLSILKAAKDGDRIKRAGWDDRDSWGIVDDGIEKVIIGIHDGMETAVFLAEDWVFTKGTDSPP